MGAWEEGRRLRRGPGGGGDRFVYGQWGEGRGRRAEPSGGRGFAALPAWTPWWHSSLAVAVHNSWLSVSRGPHPLPLPALEKRGVQTHCSSWPTRGGGP